MEPSLQELLRSLARERRCVFVAGLPASGKSFVVREAARLAAALGRTVHLLQWDVARLPFDAPAILARYPEVGGVTHAAIRVAVGRWARAAVRRWDEEHPGARDLLVGETPLIGERLMELARPRDDAVEPLLASERTAFVVPVPSIDVRRAIEDARAHDAAAARDLTSAPPDLVRAHWSEIEAAAARLGVRPNAAAGGYDPELYARTYERILRHRHVVIAPVVQVARHDPGRPDGRDVLPSADEVTAAIRDVERMAADDIDRLALDWYRT